MRRLTRMARRTANVEVTYAAGAGAAGRPRWGWRTARLGPQPGHHDDAGPELERRDTAEAPTQEEADGEPERDSVQDEHECAMVGWVRSCAPVTRWSWLDAPTGGRSPAVGRHPPCTLVRRCIAAPGAPVGPSGQCWDPTEGPSVPGTDEPRRPIDHRPGQTRREAGTQSQGSSSEDRPVAGDQHSLNIRGGSVKAILARFTVAVSLLATMALTLGAGVKWV